MKTVCRRPDPGLPGALVVPDLFDLPDGIFSGISVVLNCTGFAHRSDLFHRDRFYAVNRDLAVHLATVARERGVRYFIQMSSVSVYGRATNICESTDVLPATHYGHSKAEADDRLQALGGSDFSVLVLRPPMVYGPTAPGTLRTLVTLVRALKVLPFQDAVQPHDIVHVENLVRAVEFAVLRARTGLLLVTDPVPVTTRRLVCLVAEEYRLRRLLVPLPVPALVRRFVPSWYTRAFGGLRVHGDQDYLDEVQRSGFDQDARIREALRSYMQ